MDIKNIGNKIKMARVQQNLTQKDLADKMHVSSQLISKWETGEAVPTLEYIEELSNVLNISVVELIGEVGTKSAGKKPKKEKKPITENKLIKLIQYAIFLVCAIVITGYGLIIGLAIVPAACKTTYLENIDKAIEATVQNEGFYNLRFKAKVDGDTQRNTYLQGYIDEEGNVTSNNTWNGTAVTDGFIKKNGDAKKYIKPENINTTADLLASELETMGDENAFEFEDLTYIKRAINGYYLEFSDEMFFKDMSKSQRKNIKLEGKINGRAVIVKNRFEYLTITIKYYNIKDNEHFVLETIVEFLKEKPTINYYDERYLTWYFEDEHAVSANAFINEVTSGATKVEDATEIANIVDNATEISGKQYIGNTDYYSTVGSGCVSKENSYSYTKDFRSLYINDMYFNEIETLGVVGNNIIVGYNRYGSGHSLQYQYVGYYTIDSMAKSSRPIAFAKVDDGFKMVELDGNTYICLDENTIYKI